MVSRILNTSRVLYFSEEKSQFLSREMGWEFHKKSQLSQIKVDLCSKENVVVVLIGTKIDELELLKDFPENSLWVHLYADEIYSPKLNLALMKLKSVRGILRSYPLPETTLLGSLKRWIYANSRFLLQRRRLDSDFLHSCLSGLVIVGRQHFCKFLHLVYGISHISLIPGYTNLFASSIAEYVNGFGDGDISLLSETSQKNIESSFERPRKFAIGFVGQLGNAWRKFLLEQLMETSNVLEDESIKLVSRNGFGGTVGANGADQHSGKEYVEILCNSSFVLVPPGNYAQSTFRFLESIVCGASPLFDFHSPTDPGYLPPFGTGIDLLKLLTSIKESIALEPSFPSSLVQIEMPSDIWKLEARQFLKKANEELLQKSK